MTIINPGPWVNPENIEEQPWSTQDGIVKFFEFAKRMPGMSSRAFHLYWQKHHGPFVMSISSFSQFMRKYLTFHLYPDQITGLPDHYQQNTKFDAAGGVWLNSLSEVGDWLGQPCYEELIQPDEVRFISQAGDAEFILAKEERLYKLDMDMVESLRVSVLILVTRKAGKGYDDFHAAASAHGKLILEQPSLKDHLEQLIINHKICEPHPEGFELNNIDAVFELWFKDINAAQKFFAEADYAEKILPSEKATFNIDNIRTVIGRVRVVHDEFSFQPSTTQSLPFSWD